jgi:uncharacterized protein (TIGR01244 family)
MMVQPINPDYSVAGQVTPEELKQATEQGFQSVLNLRSPNEEGFDHDEAAIAESLGLNYANAPLTPATANEDQLAKIVAELDKLPKPTLIHCAGGMRASAIALLSIAKQEELSTEEVLERAQAAGFDYNANPKLKQLIEGAIENLAKVNA